MDGHVLSQRNTVLQPRELQARRTLLPATLMTLPQATLATLFRPLLLVAVAVIMAGVVAVVAVVVVAAMPGSVSRPKGRDALECCPCKG